jgi:hypothetical protein
MLKNRNNLPPSGYTFFQPETGWEAPKHRSFNDTVSAIIRHRMANPRLGLPTDVPNVERELEIYTVRRLQSMKGGTAFLIESSASSPPPSFRQPPSGPKQGLVAGAKKVSAGIGILLEWLGDGGEPVPHALAQTRADTCLTCPSNRNTKFTDFFTVEASELIRKQLAIRNEMALSVTGESRLGVCDICLCPLKLKVHTPIEHIEPHTSPEVKAQLPSNCWMLSEFTHK